MRQNLGTGIRIEQRPAQMQRLAARLLRLTNLEMIAELAAVAQQNPLLEVKESALAEIPVTDPSLRSHLLDQLQMRPMNERARADAMAVAGEADHDGRLPASGSLGSRLNLTSARIKEAVASVQQLEPVGVGARNLRECLLLQLQAQRPSPVRSAAMNIIRNHFSALSRRRTDLLPAEMRDEALEAIAALNPRPGTGFAQQAAEIKPELRAFKKGGLWQVELTADDDIVQIAAATQLEAPQLRKLHRAGTQLMAAMKFRRTALLAVASSAVARQRPYFERGAGFLRPLTLARIAADTGLAVSTVSTVIAGKLLHGPHGVIGLKYLMQRSTRGRDDFSAAALQMAIKKIVANEDPAQPMSDSAIAAALAADGGSPARRTVAKHRQAAGIQAAAVRKQRDLSELAAHDC